MRFIIFWAEAAAVFCSGPVSAVSFLSFDPRSRAMGGTGVATANRYNAALFNPALMIDKPSRRHSPTFFRPFAGARLWDRDDFIQSVEDFQNAHSEAALDATLQMTRNLFESGEWQVEDLRRLSGEARTLQRDINHLSNRPLRLGAAYGFTLGHSDRHFAAGYYHRRYLVLGSRIKIADVDNERLDQMIGTVEVIADVAEQLQTIEALAEQLDIAQLESLIEEAVAQGETTPALESYTDLPEVTALVQESIRAGEMVQQLDAFFRLEELAQALADNASDSTTAPPDLRRYLRYQIPESMETTALFEGAEVTENAITIALSPSRLPAFSAGVNVKWVNITTIAYEQRLEDFEISTYRDGEHRVDYGSINLDAGIGYQLQDHWRVGLMARNLVPYDYAAVNGNRIALRPLLRAGLGYSSDTLNLAVDVDLTRNEPLGFDDDKQLIGAGVEWFVWRSCALRLGYRQNLVNGEGTGSIGFGMGGYRAHLDVAAIYSESQGAYGVSLQAGLGF